MTYLYQIYLDFHCRDWYNYIMNLFYLDKNLDKCAEAHVDKHIVKMPLEVAQILCTTTWIDKHLGFVPRALNKEESDHLNSLKREIKHLPPE